MLGLAILSAGPSRLAAGPYDNLANVSVTQAGGTVSGTYALDLQGYTQINLISITVGTAGSCQDNPVSWSGSMNGWAGQSQNASWAGMLGIGGGYTLTFSNLTRNPSTGVWSAGTVYYACNASNGYVYNASSVTDAGGSLSYPGGAAHGNQSNSFTSTGSFTLGTAITWSMTATSGASNFQYAFQISGLSGSPITTPISLWNFSPLSFIYNGAAQGPTANPTPSGATYSLGGNVTAIPVGNYNIVGTGTGTYTGTGNSNWVINPAPASFSISPTSFTYNGSAQGPTIAPNPAGATYSLGGTPSATAAGSYSVSATANGNYTGSSGSVGYTISKAIASVTLSNLTKTYNGSPQGATVTTGPGGLSVSVTYNGSSTAPTNAGSYTVAATVTDSNYTGSATGTLTINPEPVTFSITPSFPYNGSAQSPTITPSVGGATYSVSGTTNATAAGSYSVTAAAYGNYTGTTTGIWTINASSASFSISPTSFTYNGSAQGPTITPSPAGVTFGTTGTAAATAAGSYTVTATANGSYSGTSGATPWTISKATPAGTLTWATPAAITYGTTLNATQLDASSTLPGTFVYTPAAGTVLNAGTQTLSVVFTPTDSTDYTSATATVTLVVNPKAVSFTVAPVSFIYNGSAQGPTLTPSPTGATFGTTGTTSATAAGSYSVTATATGNYTGTSGATSWTISKATPAGTLTWPTPAAITYGTALSGTQLDATSTLPGSFVYTPAAGAVLNAGTQTLSVTFTPTDTTDYSSATATVSLVVNPEPVTFTVAPVSFPYNGSSQGPTITPSTAGAPFGTTGTTSAIPVGSYSLTANATGNFTGTSGAITWAITKANPVITWATPAAITYGTALGATQLNATANVPGTFVYSPAAGAVLSAGAQTLSVTYTPTDGTDYNPATQTVSLTVNPAPQTVAVTPANQTVQLGQAANFTASGSSTGYTWSGATGTDASATQTWGAVGTYTVTVQAPASGNYAASNTATATVTVTLKQQTVTITPSAPTLTAGQSVTLTASGGQNAYTWGGVISGSGPTQSPSFPNVGTYTVTAFSAAGNNYAQSNTASAVITVSAAGQTVSITPTNPSVQAGQSLTFTASGGFTPYVWGGQATGTGSIQTPIFGSVGTYPVTVFAEAQGNYAQSNTATALVTATAIPQTITVTPSQATIYVNASVTLTAAGGNTSYNWGGAASGAGTTQKLSWATPGTYTVTVQAPASGNYAASNTATATISVKTTVPGIKNTSDTGTVGVQGAQATDPNAIIPPSN